MWKNIHALHVHAHTHLGDIETQKILMISFMLIVGQREQIWDINL